MTCKIGLGAKTVDRTFYDIINVIFKKGNFGKGRFWGNIHGLEGLYVANPDGLQWFRNRGGANT